LSSCRLDFLQGFGCAKRADEGLGDLKPPDESLISFLSKIGRNLKKNHLKCAIAHKINLKKFRNNIEEFRKTYLQEKRQTDQY